MIAHVIRRMGFFLLIVFAFSYSLFERKFAELHIQLPFLDFPIFVGEIFLVVCIIMLILLWRYQSIELKAWHYLLVAYIIWFLFNAFWGYFQEGPLAFRTAALFYYPLFSIIGFYFFDKRLFNRNMMIVMFIAMALILKFAFILSHYQYLYLALPFVFIIRFENKWIKIVLSLFILWIFPWEVYLGGARSRFIAFLAASLFVLLYLCIVFSKKKIRGNLLFLVMVCVLVLVIFKFAPHNKLASLYKWDGLIELYQETERQVSREEDDFEFKDIEPKLYNPAIVHISDKEFDDLVISALGATTMRKLADDGSCSLLSDSPDRFNARINSEINESIVPGKFGKAVRLKREQRKGTCIWIDHLLDSIKNDKTGSLSLWFKTGVFKKSSLYSIADTEKTSNYLQINLTDKTVDAVLVKKKEILWYCEADKEFSSNVWYHLVFIHDGVSPQFYINGEDVTQCQDLNNASAWNWEIRDHVNNVRLGCTNFDLSGNTWYFDGQIDDFRYYQRPLSENEVNMLYEEGNRNDNKNRIPNDSLKNPCSYIRFDEDISEDIPAEADIIYKEDTVEKEVISKDSGKNLSEMISDQIASIIKSKYSFTESAVEKVISKGTRLIVDKKLKSEDAMSWAQREMEPIIKQVMSEIGESIDGLLEKMERDLVVDSDQIKYFDKSENLRLIEKQLRELVQLILSRDFLHTAQKFIEEEYSSMLFRLFIWKDMIIEIFEEKAWFGINFGKPLRSKRIEILRMAQGEWSRDGWILAHNSFLFAIYRGGVIGVILNIILFGLMIKMIKGFSSKRSLTGILLCSILINFLVDAFFMSTLEIPYTAITFWSLLGMTFAYCKDLTDGVKESH